MKTSGKLRAGERHFSWVMLALSVFVLVMAYRISGFSSVSSPGTFPMVAASIMTISMIILLLGQRKQDKPETTGPKDEIRQAAKAVLPTVFLVYTAIIIIYMIAIEPLHFLPCSFVFLLVSMLYLHGAKPLKAFLVSLGSMAGIYAVFHYFFKVVLP